MGILRLHNNGRYLMCECKIDMILVKRVLHSSQPVRQAGLWSLLRDIKRCSTKIIRKRLAIIPRWRGIKGVDTIR